MFDCTGDRCCEKQKKVICMSEQSTLQLGRLCLRWRSFDFEAGQNERRGFSLIVDYARKLSQRLQVVVVCNWAMKFGLPQRILRILCGYSAKYTRLRFEYTGSEPLQTFIARVFFSKWSEFLLRIVVQEAMIFSRCSLM